MPTIDSRPTLASSTSSSAFLIFPLSTYIALHFWNFLIFYTPDRLTVSMGAVSFPVAVSFGFNFPDVTEPIEWPKEVLLFYCLDTVPSI